MKISIYADGADYKQMVLLNDNKFVRGFTTNPTLMRQNNIKNYKLFAKKILKKINNKPISFEVFTDNLDEMEIQALKIASLGKNVNVKIPITNSKGVCTSKIISSLTRKGVLINVTAVFTIDQVKRVIKNLRLTDKIILSIFAGRIADTGRDPEEIIKKCKKILKKYKNIKVLWASTRELFNIVQADRCGCNIITVPHSFLGKIDIFGKNLNEYSKETVKMFYNDAISSGYKI